MSESNQRPKAVTRVGHVRIGDATLDAYVLDNGERVFTQKAIAEAIVGKGAKGIQLSRITEKLYAQRDLDDAIEFEVPGASGARPVIAHGRSVHQLAEICGAIVEAQMMGRLPVEKLPIALNAHRLNTALAGVALVALVDEATGYQQQRADAELQRALDRMFRPEPAPWEAMFSSSLVSSLAKLYGHPWAGGSHPRFLAKANERIYRTILSTRGYEELKKRNPEPSFGSNHHQQLSADAQSYLRQQLTIVEVLANQSRDADDFWARFNRQYNGAFLQLDLEPTGT